MISTNTNQKKIKSHTWHYDLTWVLVKSQSFSNLARPKSRFAGVKGASPTDRCFHGHQTLYLSQFQNFSGVGSARMITFDFHLFFGGFDFTSSDVRRNLET